MLCVWVRLLAGLPSWARCRVYPANKQDHSLNSAACLGYRLGSQAAQCHCSGSLVGIFFLAGGDCCRICTSQLAWATGLASWPSGAIGWAAQMPTFSGQAFWLD